ncbi:MAG: shikimate dehydrogenase [Balneolales bacterium]
MPTTLSALMEHNSPFCAVIGNPISHSLSPLLHNTAAKYHNLPLQYHAVDVKDADFSNLRELFAHPQFLGANITIPYKTRIREFLDDEDVSAKEIGAVNTIVREKNLIKGYNTDSYGFTQQLNPYRKRLKGKKAVVFGSGGASKAIVHGLVQLEMAEIIIISRKPQSTINNYRLFSDQVSTGPYNLLAELSDGAELFVNTTPLGMSPNELYSPVPKEYEHILNHKICYDIVYVPLFTQFLRQAQRQNAVIIDGLDMFIHQGDKAFHHWTGKHFPYEMVRSKLLDRLKA